MGNKIEIVLPSGIKVTVTKEEATNKWTTDGGTVVTVDDKGYLVIPVDPNSTTAGAW